MINARAGQEWAYVFRSVFGSSTFHCLQIVIDGRHLSGFMSNDVHGVRSR